MAGERLLARREATRFVMLGGAAIVLAAARESSCSAQGETDIEVNVATFRHPQDTDDSQAFIRALETGRPIFVPKGVYRVTMVKLPAGTRIRGEGAQSIIRAADPDAYAVMYADSGDTAATVVDISVRALVFQGDVVSRGFREHSHLLVLQGVRDVVIDNVGFHGFRGDGLMIDGANSLIADPVKEPRHNQSVSITNCWFNGVNRENRNGISIIDGEKIAITGCRFRNITRPNMPGAIDIEPNPYPFYRVTDIAITDCTFAAIGGNVGAISLYVPREVDRAATGFSFVRNRMTNYVGTGADYSIRCDNARESQRNDIAIRGHVGSGGQRPFALLAGNAIDIAGDCSFTDYQSSALVGYAGVERVLRDVSIAGRFTRIGYAGKSSQFGLAVFRGDGLRIAGDWIDCGDGSADAAAVIFLQGRSRRVDLDHLVVRSPNGRTKRAIRIEANHQIDRATSRLVADTGGLP